MTTAFVAVPEDVGMTESGFWSCGEAMYATAKVRWRAPKRGEPPEAGVVTRHVLMTQGLSSKQALETAVQRATHEASRRRVEDRA